MARKFKTHLHLFQAVVLNFFYRLYPLLEINNKIYPLFTNQYLISGKIVDYFEPLAY